MLGIHPEQNRPESLPALVELNSGRERQKITMSIISTFYIVGYRVKGSGGHGGKETGFGEEGYRFLVSGYILNGVLDLTSLRRWSGAGHGSARPACDHGAQAPVIPGRCVHAPSWVQMGREVSLQPMRAARTPTPRLPCGPPAGGDLCACTEGSAALG